MNGMSPRGHMYGENKILKIKVLKPVTSGHGISNGKNRKIYVYAFSRYFYPKQIDKGQLPQG